MNQDEKIKHYWLYVLKLEKNKYYVGITTKTPEQRMAQHLSNFLGAKWTQKYKPVSIFDRHELGLTTQIAAEAYENKVVREYIKAKGIENVKGGNLSYSGKYVKKFGYYYKAEDWEDVRAALNMFILVIILGCAVLFLYFKK